MSELQFLFFALYREPQAWPFSAPDLPLANESHLSESAFFQCLSMPDQSELDPEAMAASSARKFVNIARATTGDSVSRPVDADAWPAGKDAGNVSPELAVTTALLKGERTNNDDEAEPERDESSSTDVVGRLGVPPAIVAFDNKGQNPLQILQILPLSQAGASKFSGEIELITETALPPSPATVAVLGDTSFEDYGRQSGSVPSSTAPTSGFERLSLRAVSDWSLQNPPHGGSGHPESTLLSSPLRPQPTSAAQPIETITDLAPQGPWGERIPNDAEAIQPQSDKLGLVETQVSQQQSGARPADKTFISTPKLYTTPSNFTPLPEGHVMSDAPVRVDRERQRIVASDLPNRWAQSTPLNAVSPSPVPVAARGHERIVPVQSFAEPLDVDEPLPQEVKIVTDSSMSVADATAQILPERTTSVRTPPPIDNLHFNDIREARDITHQIVRSLKRDTDGTIEIVLAPEELGQVKLRFVQGEDAKLILAAERPETVELIRRHQDLLHRELREAGFPRSELIFQEGQTSGGGAQRQPGQPYRSFTEAGSNSREPPVEQENPLPRRLLSSSSLDITF